MRKRLLNDAQVWFIESDDEDGWVDVFTEWKSSIVFGGRQQGIDIFSGEITSGELIDVCIDDASGLLRIDNGEAHRVLPIGNSLPMTDQV